MKDRLLVYRCKKGSSDALRRIYDKYRDHLLILAVSLCRDVSVAEDVVHDVFVRFAENLHKFELTGSLKAYLATCTVNRIRDLMRSREAKLQPLEQNVVAIEKNDGPIERLICNEELMQLSRALSELPCEQREVIALHVFSKIKMKAIAQAQGVSVETARGRYRYGINKLRSLLKERQEK